jgi:hypothetical protein
MTTELTIGSPEAAHIVWMDWTAYRAAILRTQIEGMVKTYDWSNWSKKKPKK